MLKFIVLICLFSVTNILNAQYRVEKISISGELSPDDPYDPSFGRFDAVELYLTKGDVISISIKADFPPFIALVAPSEKYFVEYTQDGSTISNYVKSITESGTWFLSIAADSADFGNYDLTANYMSANSISLPAEADLCTTIKFLLEHSKTDFSFMKKSEIKGDEIAWESKINLPNSFNNRIVLNKNSVKFSSYLLQSIDKGKVDSFYNVIVSEIGNCIGEDWVRSSKDWYVTQNKNRLKEYIFANKEKEIRKIIKIYLAEIHGAAVNHQVSIEFGSSK